MQVDGEKGTAILKRNVWWWMWWSWCYTLTFFIGLVPKFL